MAGCLPLSQWLSTPARSLMSDPTRSQSQRIRSLAAANTLAAMCAGVICLLGQLAWFALCVPAPEKGPSHPRHSHTFPVPAQGPSRIPLTLFTGCGVAGGLEQTWCGGTGTLQASSLSMSLPLRRAIGTPGALRG
ncbi:hypothetical protein CVIRNUC_000188 [Coccomyxa viridis]|uniref:Uncharacterized protein n=1 Tax=Coccomyxa viridis TaxID=1274662 RepID=A0AAV1HQ62_9CHLO|nr:hypothetical protein CVIRNUC_000188 [Coccomyxa viridis]